MRRGKLDPCEEMARLLSDRSRETTDAYAPTVQETVDRGVVAQPTTHLAEDRGWYPD